MKRRTFLMSATGATALPALGRDGSMSPSDRITMACIRTGWQDVNNVANFLEEPGAQVVTTFDLDTQHREQARLAVAAKYGYRDRKQYQAFEDALARPDLKAVMITDPARWHGVLGSASVATRRNGYCERPLVR